MSEDVPYNMSSMFQQCLNGLYDQCKVCNVKLKRRADGSACDMNKHVKVKHPQEVIKTSSSVSEVDRNKVLSNFFNRRLAYSPDVSVGNGSTSLPKMHVPQNSPADSESSDSESVCESDNASELEQKHDEPATSCWEKRLEWMQTLSNLPIATQLKEVKVCDSDFIIDINRIINSIFKCKSLVASIKDQAILKRHRSFLNKFILELNMKKKRALLLEKVHDGFLGVLLKILLSPPKSKIIQILMDADDDDACMKAKNLYTTYPVCKRSKGSAERKIDMEESSSDSEEDTYEKYLKRNHTADESASDSGEETCEHYTDSEEADSSQEPDEGDSDGEIDMDSEGETIDEIDMDSEVETIDEGDSEDEETGMNSEDEIWDKTFVDAMPYPLLPKEKFLWFTKFALATRSRQHKIIKNGNVNLHIDIDKLLTAVLYGGVLERPPAEEYLKVHIGFLERSKQSLTNFLHEPSLKKRISYLLQKTTYFPKTRNLLSSIIHCTLGLIGLDEFIDILTESWALDSDTESP